MRAGPFGQPVTQLTSRLRATMVRSTMRRAVALLIVGCTPTDHVARTLTVTTAGDAMASVRIVSPVVTACTPSCAQTFPEGSSVTLAARTPEAFAGWSDVCGDELDCTFTLDRDLDLTATFTKDPHEMGVLSPNLPVLIGMLGGLVANGDLIVGGLTMSETFQLARLSPAGQVIWSSDLVAQLPTLRALDSMVVANDVYIGGSDAAGGTLAALDLNGVVKWVISGPTEAVGVLPDGDLVAINAAIPDVEVRSQVDGALVWARSLSATLPPGDAYTPGVAAVSAQGVIAVAVVPGSSIVRFDMAGNALPAFTVGGNTATYDSQGFLDVLTGTGITRLDTTGAAVFTVALASTRSPGLVAAGVGDEIMVAASGYYAGLQAEPPAAGGLVADVSTAGALAWSVDKPLAVASGQECFGRTFSCYALTNGVAASDLHCTSSGLCALFGAYYVDDPTLISGSSYGGLWSENWIELFQQ
jgi:hypothetical protein